MNKPRIFNKLKLKRKLLVKKYKFKHFFFLFRKKTRLYKFKLKCIKKKHLIKIKSKRKYKINKWRRKYMSFLFLIFLIYILHKKIIRKLFLFSRFKKNIIKKFKTIKIKKKKIETNERFILAPRTIKNLQKTKILKKKKNFFYPNKTKNLYKKLKKKNKKIKNIIFGNKIKHKKIRFFKKKYLQSKILKQIIPIKKNLFKLAFINQPKRKKKIKKILNVKYFALKKIKKNIRKPLIKKNNILKNKKNTFFPKLNLRIFKYLTITKKTKKKIAIFKFFFFLLKSKHKFKKNLKKKFKYQNKTQKLIKIKQITLKLKKKYFFASKKYKKTKWKKKYYYKNLKKYNKKPLKKVTTIFLYKSIINNKFKILQKIKPIMLHQKKISFLKIIKQTKIQKLKKKNLKIFFFKLNTLLLLKENKYTTYKKITLFLKEWKNYLLIQHNINLKKVKLLYNVKNFKNFFNTNKIQKLFFLWNKFLLFLKIKKNLFIVRNIKIKNLKKKLIKHLYLNLIQYKKIKKNINPIKNKIFLNARFFSTKNTQKIIIKNKIFPLKKYFSKIKAKKKNIFKYKTITFTKKKWKKINSYKQKKNIKLKKKTLRKRKWIKKQKKIRSFKLRYKKRKIKNLVKKKLKKIQKKWNTFQAFFLKKQKKIKIFLKTLHNFKKIFLKKKSKNLIFIDKNQKYKFLKTNILKLKLYKNKKLIFFFNKKVKKPLNFKTFIFQKRTWKEGISKWQKFTYRWLYFNTIKNKTLKFYYTPLQIKALTKTKKLKYLKHFWKIQNKHPKPGKYNTFGLIGNKLARNTNFLKFKILNKIFSNFYNITITKHFLKLLKKNIKKYSFFFTKNQNILNLFETRLDIFWYRTKFFFNISLIRTLIKFGYLELNFNPISNFNIHLKLGDFISINYNFRKNFKTYMINNNVLKYKNTFKLFLNKTAYNQNISQYIYKILTNLIQKQNANNWFSQLLPIYKNQIFNINTILPEVKKTQNLQFKNALVLNFIFSKKTKTNILNSKITKQNKKLQTLKTQYKTMFIQNTKKKRLPVFVNIFKKILKDILIQTWEQNLETNLINKKFFFSLFYLKTTTITTLNKETKLTQINLPNFNWYIKTIKK